MSKQKFVINAVVFGHVNSGKSTTIGHLLHQCSATDMESAQRGKDSSKYAWIMEELKTEQELGGPTDFSRWTFSTTKNMITVIDTSGHCNFTKNMVMCRSQLDCAVLIISAATDEFEIGISQNGQTRAHIRIAAAQGVQQLIVAVNKMDATEPSFSEKRFDRIKLEMSNYLQHIGYQPSSLIFVPISGWFGDNLTVTSENLPWFRTWRTGDGKDCILGRTLREAFDAIIQLRTPVDKPLRLPLQTIFKIGGIGTVPMGRVESGTLRQDMMVNFAPSNLSTKVKSIETSGVYDGAAPGDHVGFNIQGISVTELQRGFVCSDVNNDPAQEVTSFVAFLIVLSHPCQISQGYAPILSCHTAQVPCEFSELIEKIHRRTGQTIEKAPKHLKARETAIVKITPTSPLSVEKFAEYPSLGRFIVSDMDQPVAIGIIIDIDKKSNTASGRTAPTKRRK